MYSHVQRSWPSISMFQQISSPQTGSNMFQHSPASGKSQLMPPCESGQYLQFEVTKATLSRICFQTSRTTVYDILVFRNV